MPTPPNPLSSGQQQSRLGCLFGLRGGQARFVPSSPSFSPGGCPFLSFFLCCLSRHAPRNHRGEPSPPSHLTPGICTPASSNWDWHRLGGRGEGRGDWQRLRVQRLGLGPRKGRREPGVALGGRSLLLLLYPARIAAPPSPVARALPAGVSVSFSIVSLLGLRAAREEAQRLLFSGCSSLGGFCACVA